MAQVAPEFKAERMKPNTKRESLSTMYASEYSIPPSRLSVRTIGSRWVIFSGLSTLGGFVKPFPITQ